MLAAERQHKADGEHRADSGAGAGEFHGETSFLDFIHGPRQAAAAAPEVLGRGAAAYGLRLIGVYPRRKREKKERCSQGWAAGVPPMPSTAQEGLPWKESHGIFGL